MQRTPRPRLTQCRNAALVAAASLLVITAHSAAVAQPAKAAAPKDSFASSFEEGDAQPDWRNTVDTGPDGAKRASGVSGEFNAGIPGNVTDRVVELRASDENTNSGEGKENLVDIQSSTKWLAFEPTAWIEFDTDAPVKVVTYALTSANDHDERDPKDWTLKGSMDGKDWKTLDTQVDQTFGERFQTKSYDFDNSTAYAHYRLDITKNNGAGDATQLADVQFSDGDTTTPPPADMRSQIDGGPGGSPTAKSNAGFTGTRALEYAGSHKPDGRAYSYNKVFDVNTPVRANTELSYKIYPAMTETDLNYPATNVSVDLAFTDGTYLSDLKALDSHGGPMTPRARARPSGCTSTSGTPSPPGSARSPPAKRWTGYSWRTTPPRARRSSRAGWTTSRWR